MNSVYTVSFKIRKFSQEGNSGDAFFVEQLARSVSNFSYISQKEELAYHAIVGFKKNMTFCNYDTLSVGSFRSTAWKPEPEPEEPRLDSGFIATALDVMGICYLEINYMAFRKENGEFHNFVPN